MQTDSPAVLLAWPSLYARLPVLMASGGCRAEEPPPSPGSCPPAERIEPPYTNEKCLKKCHGLEGFGAGAADGALRDLHRGRRRSSCSPPTARRGCSASTATRAPTPTPTRGSATQTWTAGRVTPRAPPAGVFPVDALPSGRARGSSRRPKEAATPRGGTRRSTARPGSRPTRAAPFCPRLPHRPRHPQERRPGSTTVHRANLPATCGVCHVDQVTRRRRGGRAGAAAHQRPRQGGPLRAATR